MRRHSICFRHFGENSYRFKKIVILENYRAFSQNFFISLYFPFILSYFYLWIIIFVAAITEHHHLTSFCMYSAYFQKTSSFYIIRRNHEIAWHKWKFGKLSLYGESFPAQPCKPRPFSRYFYKRHDFHSRARCHGYRCESCLLQWRTSKLSFNGKGWEVGGGGGGLNVIIMLRAE